jgi:DNA-binding response OmpR family regulator
MNLELDPHHRLVRRNGAVIRLGPTGFRIVALLAKAPDGLEREAIFERAFLDRDEPPTDTCLSAHISLLRKQIRPFGLQITEARWGLPYQLIDAPLEPADLMELLRDWHQVPA